MSTITAPSRGRVLADLLPGTRVRNAILVAGGTVLLIVAGQIAVPLPFTPVPLSLGTFAVLLTGATLGPVRGAASVIAYILLGLAGAPVFAQHGSGWAFASFGYILGFLVATVIVGMLARRKADRSIPSTLVLGALGSIAIYACGVPWLMAYAHLDLPTALSLGVLPFLIGDTIKIVATALLLPTTWRLVNRNNTPDKPTE